MTTTVKKEALGAAETIIQSLLSYADHLFHGRPGIVNKDARSAVGVTWRPVTHKEENGEKIVYLLEKVGKKNKRTRLGVLQADGKTILEGGKNVGEYRKPGFFPEVAAWMYRQVAAVYSMDNTFAAHWASYAFNQEHKDLKVVLAAFMLVQARKGDPVLEGGKVIFQDEDYRDIGEAMILTTRKDGNDFNPKLVLRARELLALPEIAAINRELGFGNSARNPFMGRWPDVAQKWVAYREENPKMLDGLVKAGFRTAVIEIAGAARYKPASSKFFQTLRWKQSQAKDGHRKMAIGEAVSAAESWEDLSEKKICEKIVKERPNYKRIVGLLPAKIGLTRAIMAAAIEAGSLSNKDLIIATPTLEELGLLKDKDVQKRWEEAIKKADDMRAANIALRVKSTEVKEKLSEASDNALKTALVDVTKGLRIYFMIDWSGSMQGAIEISKQYIGMFLQGFPADKLHVAGFNTQGREVKIPHASAAGVEAAFKGVTAGGGTDYGAGVRILEKYKPAADEDSLFIFVGDEQASEFSQAVLNSGLRPVAFGLLKTSGSERDNCVRETAAILKIPCFTIGKDTFALPSGASDPYFVPRVIRNLVAATPVGAVQGPARAMPVRVSLIDQILATPLLTKPAFAL